MRPGINTGHPLIALTALVLLGGCGGGGGSSVNSTPTPAPAPAPTPAPAPINYDTAEYRRSDAAYFDSAITAYEAGATGAGITVGIIDTGIDTASPEFSGRISPWSAAYGGNSSYQDEDGHGTAVAGILAAARNNSEIMGVAFDSTVMALRADQAGTCADTDGCSFSDSDIAAALNQATDHGARVVNISLGGAGGISPSLQQAVDRATRAGIMIVVSAGNERDKPTPDYDPSNPSPVATAMLAAGNGLVVIANSVDKNGVISSFSDLAGTAQDWVIGALGEGVRSLDIENDPLHYYTYSGTSFSAPQVAGALALLAQAFPNLTSSQLIGLLFHNARDAGATGTDDVYGRGILDIAAAFAPTGTTTLGNSSTVISLTGNGTLSSAMGDAGGATTQAVAIDSLGRAYSIGLQRSLTPGTPRAVLTPLRYGAMHRGSLSLGGFSASMSLAERHTFHDRFGETVTGGGPANASGEISLALSRDTRLAVAFNRHGRDLAGMVPDEAAPSFLSARGAERDLGFETTPSSAMMVRHRLGGRWSMTLSAENGLLGNRWTWEDDTTRTLTKQRAHDRYAMTSLSLGWRGKGISAGFAGSMLREENSLLGARLADFFGVTGAATLFADARANIDLPAHWSLSLAARRGWTSATGGGSASLATMAWDVGVARDGLFHAHDRFGLRLAQPLRVEAGGIDAWLPVAYDYATAESDWRSRRITLSPSGRELDAELSYARPLADGWLSLNGYARRQPGHAADAPADFGGAIRFSVGY